MKLAWTLLVLIPTFATAGGKLGTYDLGFKAPSISGKENNPDPATGSIIFDTSDQTFYGFAPLSSWIPLGGTSQTVPPGVMTAFAGNVAPAGYLIADGSEVSRATYSALFDVIGTTYGSGNGTTTFNLPDTRGIFVRGAGSQTIAGETYSATLGARQGDATAKNGLYDNGHRHPPPDGQEFATRFSGNSSYTGTYQMGATTNPTGIGYADIRSGDNETRPANLAVNYIIKY